MSNKKVYVVIMYRWGDARDHSYVTGVFNDERRARHAANKEEESRGGKYSAMILEVELNAIGKEHKTVREPVPFGDRL